MFFYGAINFFFVLHYFIDLISRLVITLQNVPFDLIFLYFTEFFFSIQFIEMFTLTLNLAIKNTFQQFKRNHLNL